eukprot:6198079-Pleurochrysis_carterae.AAC.2
MSQCTFKILCRLIRNGGRMHKAPHHMLARAHRARDLPTLRFKVAACLYFLAHGAPTKVAADVASIGVSTLRKWLQQFCDAVITDVKPEYMPGTPPDAERLADVRAQFASRRGLQNVAMACDGTHVPFNPDKTYNKNDFRNYKGWYSLLVVAFVDSFHLFIDADVGYAGRSGDNTVLKLSWLMKRIQEDPEAWLGEDGVIVGDGGA